MILSSRIRSSAVLAVGLTLVCGAGAIGVAKERPAMQLSSSSFAAGEEIPSKHTCEGADRSPALAWTGVPAGTKSFAIIVDDPDAPDPAAPRMTWVHWVLYNLPPSTSSLPEAAVAMPRGTLDGINDWKSTGYRGPCPPIGRHRYFFKVYALDVVLPDLHKPSKAALEKAMHGHMLAHAELVGTYKKK
jgi:Raf kinase inhibitor-like YbhB/YbcL family protein